MSSAVIKIGPGDILECRTRRRDGSAERVRIEAIDNGAVVVEVLNPRNARQPARRRLPLIGAVGCGRGQVAHYKLVERLDGTRISYPVGGPQETGGPA